MTLAGRRRGHRAAACRQSQGPWVWTAGTGGRRGPCRKVLVEPAPLLSTKPKDKGRPPPRTISDPGRAGQGRGA